MARTGMFFGRAEKLVLCLALGLSAGLIPAGSSRAAENDPFPRMAHAYAVEVDGQPVWSRQLHKRLPQASLTKLMTALLVVEHLRPEEPVTSSQGAARETGSRMGLKAGETLAAEDLLAATLMASANDACRALADHVGGSQAGFVQRMNTRAAELGLRDTRFVNACGHDAPGHYSTVADLVQLARLSMNQPRISALAGRKEMQIQTINGASTYRLRNSNALIGAYGPAVGLKTGTTARAGKCLVAVARKGGAEVLLVMLNGADRWWDAVDVLELAFARQR